MTNLSDLSNCAIRVTEDFRYSIFDAIRIIGKKKNPHSSWINFCQQYPIFSEKVSRHQFPGRGQQLTLVAESGDIQTILSLLPDLTKREILGTKYTRQCEEYYRRILFEKHGGQTEVVTPAGVIDLPISERRLAP